MYIKPSVCRLGLGMIGGTSIASGGLVDVGRDPRPLSSGGEVNKAAVVISPISNSSRSRGRTLAMTGHRETHLQDVLAWRHRKAMQEQCSCPLMRKPCSWVLIYTYPLLNGFHEYAVPQANVAHHFSTSSSCFPVSVLRNMTFLIPRPHLANKADHDRIQPAEPRPKKMTLEFQHPILTPNK